MLILIEQRLKIKYHMYKYKRYHWIKNNNAFLEHLLALLQMWVLIQMLKWSFRFEMPYNIWCGGCNSHIGMGVRYNAEKKKVGNYYSTPIWQFRMKCHLCDNYFEIQTDPQVGDFIVRWLIYWQSAIWIRDVWCTNYLIITRNASTMQWYVLLLFYMWRITWRKTVDLGLD